MKRPVPWYARALLFVVWPLIAPVLLALIVLILLGAWVAILHPDFELEWK